MLKNIHASQIIPMQKTDVIIIGAGAAGLMCAIEAGKRQRHVMIIDHANKPGKKILMSGGGRCNFTNYVVKPENFISHNPHFCISALSRYTSGNFIDLVKSHGIPFHEKTLGQLFCDNKAKDIVDMLLKECAMHKVDLRLSTSITKIDKINDNLYQIQTSAGDFQCQSLVIATGGLSIPTMGASPFGYHIAEQFGLHVWPTRAGLVPLTLHEADKEISATLSGIAINSLVKHSKKSFRENILFTHRGLSGPAILQISSYWAPGETLIINMVPDVNMADMLKDKQKCLGQKLVKNIIAEWIPKRVIDVFMDACITEKKLAACSYKEIDLISQQFNHWQLKPNGTEGYRTAEVTIGGVDCSALSSKTFEVMQVPGLFFIGEVLDMTGWLGGYNFQWAWSSGWAAGQVV
jgi:predicted Rossmann fold flavoprotein